ncbi:hypothetical protein H072_3449 [Dactylellina haptotyla CBS 200.50]|uniref:Uncharacterized protein n=1 Tax=Dactylellina haptotyla (strain CBS 200.50) TaxID=1284197 RepID=S8AIA2_DACHA|nr:hypothetical protein H072_3449 [Dactylellina haptotyla CBS 200.50]
MAPRAAPAACLVESEDPSAPRCALHRNVNREKGLSRLLPESSQVTLITTTSGPTNTAYTPSTPFTVPGPTSSLATSTSSLDTLSILQTSSEIIRPSTTKLPDVSFVWGGGTLVIHPVTTSKRPSGFGENRHEAALSDDAITLLEVFAPVLAFFIVLGIVVGVEVRRRRKLVSISIKEIPIRVDQLRNDCENAGAVAREMRTNNTPNTQYNFNYNHYPIRGR